MTRPGRDRGTSGTLRGVGTVADRSVEPLRGRRVVVTRARPGRLDVLLAELGAEVVSVPVIATADPPDAGAALNRAVAAVRSGRVDWVVATSAVGVERLFTAVDDASDLGDVSVAAIGPATARAFADHGVDADLIPDVAVAEDLVASFPAGSGRIVQIRPEVARDVVAPGLRAKGWQVDEVVAYRTVAVKLDEATRAGVRAADAVTFTSTSTVEHLLAAVGAGGLPPHVVSIGPVTTSTLAARGIVPAAEASPHTIEGLAAAVVAALTVPDD